MAKIYSQLPGKSQFSCSPGAGAHGSGPVPFKAWRLMKPSLSPTVNIQPALSEQVCNITCWQQEIFFNLLNTHTHARLPHTGSHARTKVLKKGIFPGNRWKTINKMVGKAFWFSLLREAIDRGHMWGDFILSFRKQGNIFLKLHSLWASAVRQLWNFWRLKSAGPWWRTRNHRDDTAQITILLCPGACRLRICIGVQRGITYSLQIGIIPYGYKFLVLILKVLHTHA